MNQVLNIGTRESALALWQTRQVLDSFSKRGIHADIIPIKSEGDINLTQPLYELGVQGIFTKALDMALLSGKIDLAVHSYKDVPTQIADGLEIAAVLKRGNHGDVLVLKDGIDPSVLKEEACVIASSSMRRRAQWLHRYPTHQMENLRGNIQKRMEKLGSTDHWTGAIFAAAALERLELTDHNIFPLPWMLPAPAQGAMVVLSRKGDAQVLNACAPLHDPETAHCVAIEREFLRGLLGGCATPVGAFARIEKELLHFQGNLFSPDGRITIEVEEYVPVLSSKDTGKQFAAKVLSRGGGEIIRAIRDIAPVLSVDMP